MVYYEDIIKELKQLKSEIIKSSDSGELKNPDLVNKFIDRLGSIKDLINSLYPISFLSLSEYGAGGISCQVDELFGLFNSCRRNINRYFTERSTLGDIRATSVWNAVKNSIPKSLDSTLKFELIRTQFPIQAIDYIVSEMYQINEVIYKFYNNNIINSGGDLIYYCPREVLMYPVLVKKKMSEVPNDYLYISKYIIPFLNIKDILNRREQLILHSLADLNLVKGSYYNVDSQTKSDLIEIGKLIIDKLK